MNERRSNRRYNLQLTCAISTSSPDAQAPCELVTDNISSGGAYLYTTSPYPVGTRLKIQIMIRRSSHSDLGFTGACINVWGEVLRIDTAGMAVEFDDQYRIFQIGLGNGRKHAAGYRDVVCEADNNRAVFDQTVAMEE